ncbi:hypothetical protein KOI35_15675 [Actinoplanes bogorensis]|uniref:Uncharacterized protein n=1 Tax=Paractinoplanes bogorensis TaxID=1610840 RepID=A0ABS5YNC5_9ACTN|nr:hypothetical protein [Actinoplanes bogorensis]MBU2664942.1 hypothetical protein [Actinoplanes bogorensis]
MTDPPTDLDAIDALIRKVTASVTGLTDQERALLAQLFAAGRNTMLGESTIHTFVHGRREGESADDSSRIGSRIGSARSADPDGGDDGPAVQITIWVRR